MITIVLENFGILGFWIPVVTDLIFPFWVEDFYKIFNRIKIMEGNTLVFTLNWKLFFFCNTDVVKASTFLNLLFWLPSSALSFFEIFEKSSIIQFQIKDNSNRIFPPCTINFYLKIENLQYLIEISKHSLNVIRLNRNIKTNNE